MSRRVKTAQVLDAVPAPAKLSYSPSSANSMGRGVACQRILLAKF